MKENTLMKVLFAVSPAAGHLNPLLAIARMVLDRGDEAVVVTGTYLRRAVEQSGASFRSLLGAAAINFSRPEEIVPDRMRLPPGPALSNMSASAPS